MHFHPNARPLIWIKHDQGISDLLVLFTAVFSVAYAKFREQTIAPLVTAHTLLEALFIIWKGLLVSCALIKDGLILINLGKSRRANLTTEYFF